MMRTRRLTAVLVGLCVVCGCAEREPAARPEAMLPRPGAATRVATSRPDDPAKNGRVLSAGMLQVYERFISIEDVMSMGRLAFERLDGTLERKAFGEKASPVVDDVVRRIIVATLALTESEGELTELQKSAIEAGLKRAQAEMVSAAGGSMEQLRHRLAARGLELDQVIESERRDLTIDHYYRRKYMPSIVITRKMMWKYYEANRDQYVSRRRVCLRVIAVPAAALLPQAPEGSAPVRPTAAQYAAAQAESRKIVRQAAAQISGGAEFAAVARDVGTRIRERYGKRWDAADFRGKSRVDIMVDDGGLWPERSPEGFPDDVLARAAKELDEGRLSKVEETDDCCYLVQAHKVLRARDVSFEEAQEHVEKLLRGREYVRRKGIHMMKRHVEFNSLQTAEDRKRAVLFTQMVLDRVVARYCEN